MKRSGSVVVAGVTFAMVLAFSIRLQYIELYGGDDPTYLHWARSHYFGGLSEFYLAAAEGLLRGDAYRETVYPPGYPVALAAFHMLGCEDARCLRWIQVAVDSAAVLPLALVTVWAGFGAMAAIGVACAYALHPLWAAGSTFLLADSLSPVLVITILTALVWASRSRRIAAWVLPGVAMGASLLVRPDLALFVILAVGWCVWVTLPPRRWWAAATLVAATFASVLPWGVHNRMTHGVWLFTSSGGGSGLWQGLGTIPNEYGFVVSDSAATARLAAAGLRFNSIEGDAFLKREYLRAVREHPGHVLRVVLDRWWGILTTSERLQPLFFGRVREWLDRTGALACAAALVLARHHAARVLLIAAPPLYALMSVGIVYFEPRYIRYTHIGYLFAFLTLAGALLAYVQRRSPRAAGAIRLIAITGSVIYAARELRHLYLAA